VLVSLIVVWNCAAAALSLAGQSSLSI
jgi:hypothetical protein